MDTNSLVLRVKGRLKCSRLDCMRMGMARRNSLDSSYLHTVVVVDVVGSVVDDNSTDRMGMVTVVVVAGMDTGDLDRLVAELLIVFSSLALGDRQTAAEIHECVAVVVHPFHFVRAKLCST